MLLLVVIFIITSQNITDIALERSYDILWGKAENYVGRVDALVERDIRLLETTADILSRDGNINVEEALPVLTLANACDLFKRTELLFPDGRIYRGDNEWSSTLVEFSFESVASKGTHISGRWISETDPGSYEMYAVSPVIIGGKATALLCGVIDLKEQGEIIRSRIVNENIQVLMFMSENGDILVNTATNQLGNILQMEGENSEHSRSLEELLGSINKGQSGETSFMHPESGEKFYCVYTTTNVSAWTVLVTMPESDAISAVHDIREIFYVSAAVEAMIFVAYFAWLLFSNKVQTDKNLEQLGRVRYMLEVEKTLFNAPQDSKLFTDALRCVAMEIGAKRAFFQMYDRNGKIQMFSWRTDGDYDVEVKDKEFYPILAAEFFENGRLLIKDTKQVQTAGGQEYKHLEKLAVSNIMAIPVKILDGEPIGALGIANVKCIEKNMELLECVMLSFAMAAKNMESFRSIEELGIRDQLTGLLNRNSFQLAIKKYEDEHPDSFACMYIDADGLHEVNSHLGHTAGDVLLKTIADAIKECFGDEDSYRIGGDEFVIFRHGITEQQLTKKIKIMLRMIEGKGYHISIGVEWRRDATLLSEVVKRAEGRMYAAKRSYYESRNDDKQMRGINYELEEAMTQKHDLEIFRTVLSTRFLGVYIVNLSTDTVRSVYLPSYFAQMLKKSGGKFSTAMREYINKCVIPEYQKSLMVLTDLERLDTRLKRGEAIEHVYSRPDGVQFILKIHVVEEYSELNKECVWTFEVIS